MIFRSDFLNNLPLVSVIVPIYNCESVLNRCIDSLVNQTYANTEIILVNDGSKDNSAEICNKYAEKYSNVVYVYQKNQGVSAARNKGLSVATGEYFIFCDADDYYSLDAVEKLVAVADKNNADITIGGVKKFIGEDIQVACVDDYVVDRGSKIFGECINELTESFLINSPVAKLYKMSLIKGNELYFNETLHCGEDLEWNSRVFAQVERIAGLSEAVYMYCVENAQSLSQRVSDDYFDRINLSFESLLSLYSNLGLLERYEKSLWSRQDSNIWRGFFKINDSNCNYSKKEKKQYIYNGLNSECFHKYEKRKKHYISFVKRFTLSIHNATIMYLIISLLGKINRLKSRNK